jgi:two-component system cell cycle sensor histidine kinase/response regulator CckA
MLDTAEQQINVLLVEDDDEDYLLTRELFARLPGPRYTVHRSEDSASALAAVSEGEYDVCLVDYRLGPDNGVELVRALVASGCDVPIIVLTGQGDRDVDVEAASAGAADYLVKDEIGPTVLERTIRYAIRSHEQLRELRRHEETLRHAQRMEAIGQLAGGIAHDFSNLLLVIRGYSTLVLDTVVDEKLRDQVSRIDQAAERAAELTAQLLAYSRQQVLMPETTQLNAVVEDTLKLLDRVLGDDVDVRAEYDENLPAVLIDPSQVGQVILNLAINARDAMPGGGALSIRTRAVELDDVYARAHAEVTPGPYVLLEITDSGVGMDSETQSRVFDPYFTTKETGNGLGLATVYGIVRQSGGHIWLYSEVGLGTTFRIYFPPTDTELQRAPTVETSELSGVETILIVEDAPMVRTLVSEMLKSYGYTVLEAENGREAVAIVRDHDGPIDLLLTDVVMPELNGRELADELVVSRPGMRVLFTSGYPADTIVRSGIADADVEFIQKPYLANDLAQKIRSLLSV